VVCKPNVTFYAKFIKLLINNLILHFLLNAEVYHAISVQGLPGREVFWFPFPVSQPDALKQLRPLTLHHQAPRGSLSVSQFGEPASDFNEGHSLAYGFIQPAFGSNQVAFLGGRDILQQVG